MCATVPCTPLSYMLPISPCAAPADALCAVGITDQGLNLDFRLARKGGKSKKE